MQKVERSTRLAAPPESVFGYIADLAHLADWQSGIVSAELTSDGAMGVGSTARIVRQMMGQRITAPLSVTEYDPPRHLAIGSEVSGVRALATLDLRPAGAESTDLTFAMEIRGSMLTAFMEPMIAGAAGGDIEASLERLQRIFPGPDPG